MAAPTPQNKQILVARLYVFLSIENTLKTPTLRPQQDYTKARKNKTHG